MIAELRTTRYPYRLACFPIPIDRTRGSAKTFGALSRKRSYAISKGTPLPSLCFARPAASSADFFLRALICPLLSSVPFRIYSLQEMPRTAAQAYVDDSAQVKYKYL